MRCKHFGFSALTFSSVVALSMAPSMAQANEVKAEAAPSGARAAIAVEGAPIEAEGFWLNAYYFVRSGDADWAKISETLYGRADRAALLRKWNKKVRLKIGEIVYYNSPSRPDDSKNIKVFAEDFGAQLEEITIQKGDSLSKIGLDRFGNLRSWREISALNPELTNPDIVAVGQVIRIQPKQVNTKAVLSNIINEVTKIKAGLGEDTQLAQNDHIDQEEQIPAPAPATQATVQNTQSDLPPPAAVAAPEVPPATNTIAQNQDIKEPPATAPPVQKELPSAKVAKTPSALRPISFKTSSLLGLIGTALLLLSVVMVLGRRFSRTRASKESAVEQMSKGIPSSKRSSPF